jgi:electron transfer flavoprotein alpha subunit
VTVLVLAEHDGVRLSPDTARAVGALTGLGDAVHVLVAGSGVSEIAAAASRIGGVGKVLHADGPTLEHQLAEPLAALIVSLADGYDVIAAAASSTGKSTMPRVAALLDVMQVSDVIAVEGPRVFKRPIYAGNAIQTVEATDGKVVLTIRTPVFEVAAEGGNALVEAVAVPEWSGRTRHVETRKTVSERPELGAARVVLSGGRALGSKEQFDALLGPLADKLNAALGASRAAVDAGYAANDLQVGQTGKVVAPELYIACGISGAIQHVAGIKAARVIVAINSDPGAPIFALADYGLVGDIFTLVPELTAKL